jgi:regulator of protease activity HflC (stomatin/prohibitin superfamily)
VFHERQQSITLRQFANCGRAAHNRTMKRQAEMIEGPEAWKRFEGAVKKILTVPHAEVQRRIAEYRKTSASNPNRRGPKRKG